MDEETIADVVAVLRSITFATKVHDAMSLSEVYDILRKEASHIEKAMEAAAAQREAFWIERVKAAMEVADQFKSTLEHVLDGLMFAKQEKVK